MFHAFSKPFMVDRMSKSLLKYRPRNSSNRFMSGWALLLLAVVSISAVTERQRLFAELQSEASILHRLASQRADQHDAHLTSLSA